MKCVVLATLALGALGVAQDPTMFKQLLANSAKEIDLAEDSEHIEKQWCQDTSKFLQKSISFTSQLEASVSNDHSVLQQDRDTRAFDASFISFLGGVLNIDATVVTNLQAANAKMKTAGGLLCHGYEQHALDHREAALEKSVKISDKLAHPSELGTDMIPYAKSLLEIQNQNANKAHAHANNSKHLLCEHMELAKETLAREQRDVEVADATSKRIALVSESQRARSQTVKELVETAHALQDRFENIRNVDKQRFGSEDPVVGQAAVVLADLGTILMDSSKRLASTNSYQMRNFLRQAEQVRSQMSDAVSFLEGMKGLCDQKSTVDKRVSIPKIVYKPEALVATQPPTASNTKDASPLFRFAAKAAPPKPVAKYEEQKKINAVTDDDLLNEAAESLGLRA